RSPSSCPPTASAGPSRFPRTVGFTDGLELLVPLDLLLHRQLRCTARLGVLSPKELRGRTWNERLMAHVTPSARTATGFHPISLETMPPSGPSTYSASFCSGGSLPGIFLPM